MAETSPAGDPIQLAADVVGDTVAQLERRIRARFGALVVRVQEEAGQSHVG